MTIRARVRNSRLLIDAPIVRTEGTALDPTVEAEGDDLGDTERAALDAAISRAWAAAIVGQVRSADEVLQRLRRR